MKTLKCDLCEHEARGETFEGWMKALMPHYMEAHADVMNAHSRDKEPWRFLTAMILITVGIIAINFDNVIVAVLGAVYLLLLLVTRMIYISFRKRPKQT